MLAGKGDDYFNGKVSDYFGKAMEWSKYFLI